MSMIRKIEFDAKIQTFSPLEVVDVCRREVEYVYETSGTVGGRKWAFSQYRAGWTTGKDLIPPHTKTDIRCRKMSNQDQPDTTWNDREQYTQDIAATVLRLARCVDHDTLRSMVVLAMMRLDHEDSEIYRIQKHDAIVRDQDSTRNRRYIVAVDRFIEIGEMLLDGRSYLDRILGVCALSGRRTIEIGTSAVLDYVDTNHVGFRGQAKTVGRGDIGRYVVPVLTNAKKMIDTLASIRSDKPDLVENPAVFHNRCAKDLHKRARIFSEVFRDGEAKPKDLRPAWAEIVWSVFDERRTGKALFLSRVLGHGANDLMTAQAYDDFLIDDPEYNS